MSNTLTGASPIPAREAKPPAGAEVPVFDQEMVIQPQRGWIAVNVGEMWRYRELLFFLVWRDVKVRYKQTVLGVAWAILQPLFNMIVFTVIFGKVAGLEDHLPAHLKGKYPIFVYVGMLVWTFFSTGVTTGGQSLVNSQHLLTKIYFPRLFVPLATIGGGMVDLAISFGLFLVLMLIYQVPPGWGLLALPVLLVLTLMATAGVAFVMSALTVSYRDFRFIVPFMVQAWMYLSATFYDVADVGRWQLPASINPMFGLIGAHRSCLLGMDWHWMQLGISTVMTLGIFFFGVFYFRKVERKFADIA